MRCEKSFITSLSEATLCAFLCAVLASCYSPNQQKLEKDLRSVVQPGMTVSTAVDRLSARGFRCEGNRPLTCSRLRQRLLPSSCIERVNLEPADRASLVTVVDVRPILCVGL